MIFKLKCSIYRVHSKGLMWAVGISSSTAKFLLGNVEMNMGKGIPFDVIPYESMQAMGDRHTLVLLNCNV